MAESYPDLNERFDYEWGTLADGELDSDPIVALGDWLHHAASSDVHDFNAMVLATVDAEGRPSSRNVLLRGVENGRLQFFTNRSSRKGLDIEANPRVSLLFSWLPVHRQLRVDGTAVKLSDATSDEYFDSRPRDSRIAAWASAQSEVLASRDALDAAMLDQVARFGDGPIPRPDFWGGYAVVPTIVEFWQGRPSRLHDRIRYRRDAPDAPWVIERLAP